VLVSQTPPDLIAEATKRAGLIWIVIGGQDRPSPAWHIWRPGTGPEAPGAAYVVTGPGEQPLPGLAGAGRVTVIVAGGAGLPGGRMTWTAAVSRVEPGSAEWDEVIGQLVAGRLNAVLAEGETSPARRWAASGAVFRLAPVLADPGSIDTEAPNSRTVLSAAPLAVHPRRRLAGHRRRGQKHQCCHSHQCGGSLMHRSFRSLLAVAAAGGLCLAGGMAAAAPAFGASTAHRSAGSGTATPIQHVVVIFQENVSFDHYFGTYPHAADTDGNPFHARPGTPSVNGLTPALLTHNPNSANPTRLTPAQALTCDQDHGYTAEQKAMDGGLMDKFVEETGVSTCSPPNFGAPGLVMNYYDGNTVTGLWNYAQRYAMSDNFYDTEFGPSTPGALNLVSGQTGGGTPLNAAGQVVPDPGAVGSPGATGAGTVYGDPDPFYDGCSNHSNPTVKMSGQNIGDLLNAKGITWGWFQGGFAPTSTTTSGTPVCGASHTNIGGVSVADYSPHHNPFEYYKSTANPDHTPPASVAEVGRGGPANHEYDLSWFFKALKGGNLPSVSYLKAAEYQDGHAGYSDPIDEQHFLVNTVNAIQRSKFWRSTAIMITYDDSDGWYDHVMPPIINSSADPALDALNGPGVCGHGTPMGGIQDRCGYGQRLPLLVISPYARTDYVSGAIADQTSVLAFIEDNWLGGQRTGTSSFDNLAGSLDDMFSWDHPSFAPYLLNPVTGEPTR
jgi:phospholipase C